MQEASFCNRAERNYYLCADREQNKVDTEMGIAEDFNHGRDCHCKTSGEGKESPRIHLEAAQSHGEGSARGCGAHHHHHGHHHTGKEVTGPRLFWASIVNFGFAGLEIVGGILSNSLSLISDAVHNLTDATSILVAYVANIIGKRKPNARHTFGFRRAEIIAAFFNAVALIVICVFLFVEAYKRFRNPEEIKGNLMLTIAVAGLVANVVSMVILHSSRKKNLNVRAAYLHLLGDTLSSVAVIGGGIAMILWRCYWLDPLITVFVGVYIIWHTWGVVRETVEILMQAVPPELDVYEVQDFLNREEGVGCAHHIHVWRLSDEALHFEAHIELAHDMRASESAELIARLTRELNHRYEISHVTLQMEYRPDHDARQAICECE